MAAEQDLAELREQRAERSTGAIATNAAALDDKLAALESRMASIELSEMEALAAEAQQAARQSRANVSALEDMVARSRLEASEGIAGAEQHSAEIQALIPLMQDLVGLVNQRLGDNEGAMQATVDRCAPRPHILLTWCLLWDCGIGPLVPCGGRGPLLALGAEGRTPHAVLLAADMHLLYRYEQQMADVVSDVRGLQSRPAGGSQAPGSPSPGSAQTKEYERALEETVREELKERDKKIDAVSAVPPRHPHQTGTGAMITSQQRPH